MAPAIIDPLVNLFNFSLLMSSLPSGWKLANVVPVFKGSGKRNNLENYRPISLTSIIGKLLESIIYQKLNRFLEDNSAIPISQFGFREGRSCTHQLLKSFHEWSSVLDERTPSDIHVVSFDWSKAFDSVCHKRLVFKLERAGVNGHILRWLRDFLSNRFQRVVYRGEFSSYLPVRSGVP